ncbi:hypothetical protein [Bacillus massilinigeriensis]|uniref:hypothetical protein n=1 Tax=Bacillus mediterraneensis TaxID=1805474 RepID=UPI0013565D58|nr:hypothetical protein [Bacillus mediterraneensis]
MTLCEMMNASFEIIDEESEKVADNKKDEAVAGIEKDDIVDDRVEEEGTKTVKE